MKKLLFTLTLCTSLQNFSMHNCEPSPTDLVIMSSLMTTWGTCFGLALLSRTYPILRQCIIINAIHGLLGPEGRGEITASVLSAFAVATWAGCNLYICSE